MTDRDDQGRLDPQFVIRRMVCDGETWQHSDDVERYEAAVDAAHRAEIARLTQERDEWKGAHDALERVDLKTRDRLRQAEAERDALAAQIAGLREALVSCVVELSWLIQQVKARPGGSVDSAYRAGLAALAASAPEGGSHE